MAPSGGQICNQCKGRHLVAKFGTNASGAIWWPNLELMQGAPSGGQICNKCKRCHLVDNFQLMQIAPSGGQIGTNALHYMLAKFSTNTCGTTYNWPNLEPTQVEFYLAGEITQVIDSIPWVRCASGNVYGRCSLTLCSTFLEDLYVVIHALFLQIITHFLNKHWFQKMIGTRSSDSAVQSLHVFACAFNTKINPNRKKGKVPVYINTALVTVHRYFYSEYTICPFPLPAMQILNPCKRRHCSALYL